MLLRVHSFFPRGGQRNAHCMYAKGRLLHAYHHLIYYFLICCRSSTQTPMKDCLSLFFACLPGTCNSACVANTFFKLLQGPCPAAKHSVNVQENYQHSTNLNSMASSVCCMSCQRLVAVNVKSILSARGNSPLLKTPYAWVNALHHWVE